MSDDSAPCFVFPAICAKKVTAAFDGGWLTSDGGVLLLAQAERRLRLATALARRIADRRDQSRVGHGVDDILVSGGWRPRFSVWADCGTPFT